jgi:hypothetical protein
MSVRQGRSFFAGIFRTRDMNIQYTLVQRAYRYGWSYAIEFAQPLDKDFEVKKLASYLRVDNENRPAIDMEVTWKTKTLTMDPLQVRFYGSPKLAAMRPSQLEVQWLLDKNEAEQLERITLEFLTSTALGERN